MNSDSAFWTDSSNCLF